MRRGRRQESSDLDVRVESRFDAAEQFQNDAIEPRALGDRHRSAVGVEHVRVGGDTDQLRGIDEQDALLVVSFPPYTQLTIDAVEYAAEAGARIVAVTDSAVSPAACHQR